MPDLFITLPMPLPLMILESIEDLSTLSYLLQSSPVANVIFETYYCEIAEVVLSNLAPQLQRLLRTLIFIRSNSLSIAGQLISPEALDSFLKARVLNDDTGAGRLSNARVSLVAVRSFIKSANRVQEVTASFFEILLDRLNSIKPFYLPDKSYDFDHCRAFLSEEEYCANLPEGRRYAIMKCGPPSWIEEQRVRRALWRLQLYFDLIHVTRQGLGVTSKVCDLLKDEGPHRVWNKLQDYWERDEMDCVYEHIREFSDALATLSARSPHLYKLPATESRSVTVARPIPYYSYVSFKWGQTTEHLDRSSAAISCFHRIRVWFDPQLPRSSFPSFRRLGFEIWDREKMARLGLITAPGFLKQRDFHWVGPVSDASGGFEHYFRWKSVIGRESAKEQSRSEDIGRKADSLPSTRKW